MEVGNENKRLPYLDYARVFVAYLVIFGHLLPNDDMTIRPYIYAFHMPFFFLVSGLLHKYDGTVQWRKYVRILIVPFIFFNVVFFLLKPILYWNGIWNAPKSFEYITFAELILQYLPMCTKRLITGIDAIDGPTWFLVALFWCKIFTDLLKKWPILWVIYIALYIVFPLTHHGLIFLRQACQALPFYFIGFYFKQNCHKIQFFPICTKLFLFFLTFGLSVLLTAINGKVSLYATIYGKFPIYVSIWIFYLNAFLGAFSVLFLSSIFKESNHIKKIAFALITILGAQFLFILSFRKWFGAELSVHYIWISLVILFGCVAIHQLIEKYIPFILGKRKEKK